MAAGYLFCQWSWFEPLEKRICVVRTFPVILGTGETPQDLFQAGTDWIK